MSHLKERAQKNCLNCNSIVQGRYCHNCGQENIEPKETVWHLVSHFFQDITHFDGKFFSTIKYLFTKPGFLSREYMEGRRARYVNPVRLYVFTSAFFFLLFFSFFKVDKHELVNGVTVNGKTLAQIEAMDSLAFDAFTKRINKEDGKNTLPMTREEFQHYIDSTLNKGFIQINDEKYESKAQYDSAQKMAKNKDGVIARAFNYKIIEINERYKKEGGVVLKEYISIILHSLPQMFFILLPFFALILKLLYSRKKEYYYVNHSIFSIHFYIFTFLTTLVVLLLDKINTSLQWRFITYINLVMELSILFYLYKSMHNFYRGGRAITMLKFFLLCLSLLITFIVIFLFFILYSLYKL